MSLITRLFTEVLPAAASRLYKTLRLSQIFREVIRPIAMAGGAALLLWLANWLPKELGEDSAMTGPFLYSGAAVMGMIALSHITRRLFFTKLDLQKIALRAIEEKNMPAAVVFLAVCIILATIIISNVLMMA